MMPAAALHIS